MHSPTRYVFVSFQQKSKRFALDKSMHSSSTSTRATWNIWEEGRDRSDRPPKSPPTLLVNYYYTRSSSRCFACIWSKLAASIFKAQSKSQHPTTTSTRKAQSQCKHRKSTLPLASSGCQRTSLAQQMKEQHNCSKHFP